MDNLPVEKHIADFLDDRSKRYLRAATSAWFAATIIDNFTFYYTTNDQLAQIIATLKRRNSPLRICFTKHRLSLSREHFQELSQLTQLISLTTTEVIPTREDEDYEPLTSLPNLEMVPLAFPMKLVPSFANLTSIRILVGKSTPHINLQHFSRLVDLTWMLDTEPTENPLNDLANPELLTSLKMKNGMIGWLQESKFSNLRHLKITPLQHGEISLPSLPKLENLALHMRGYIPSLATSFPNLTELEVRYITDPTGSVSTLAYLTKLQKLSLCVAMMERAGQLHFMTALTNLAQFRSLPMGPDPDEYVMLNNIPSDNLTLLEAIGANIQHLMHLTNVVVLSIRGQVFNPDLLGTFTQLTALELGTEGADDFSVIERLTNLRSLSLGQQQYQEKKGKFRVDKLVNLETLLCTGDVFRNGCWMVDEKSLIQLPLKKLMLTQKVDDKVLKVVSQIRTLEWLLLQDVKVGPQKLSYLTSLARLTSLEMDCRKKVTGVILTSLTSLQRLVVRYHGDFGIDAETLKRKLPYLWDCDVQQRVDFWKKVMGRN